MSSKWPSDWVGHPTAFAWHARPLGEPELAFMQRGIKAIAPEWTVELEGICANETILVVLPESGDDEIGPTFAISRDTYGLRVDQIDRDELTEVGIYTSFSDVLDSLRIRLAFGAAGGVRGHVTLH